MATPSEYSVVAVWDGFCTKVGGIGAASSSSPGALSKTTGASLSPISTITSQESPTSSGTGCGVTSACGIGNSNGNGKDNGNDNGANGAGLSDGITSKYHVLFSSQSLILYSEITLLAFSTRRRWALA